MPSEGVPRRHLLWTSFGYRHALRVVPPGGIGAGIDPSPPKIQYIPIGAQCTTPTLLTQLGLKTATLPFDWMFSTPAFVYAILSRLLTESESLDAILDTHFFACDARATLGEVEHHTTAPEGPVLVNSAYRVSFPHNTLSDRETYRRRLARLRGLLLDPSTPLCFVYVSVSSPTRGNYTLDGSEPIQDLYGYLGQIHTLLQTKRGNASLLVFDTARPPSVVSPDPHTFRIYDLQPKSSWGELLPELLHAWGQLTQTTYTLHPT
jgi:hypothetical protein